MAAAIASIDAEQQEEAAMPRTVTPRKPMRPQARRGSIQARNDETQHLSKEQKAQRRQLMASTQASKRWCSDKLQSLPQGSDREAIESILSDVDALLADSRSLEHLEKARQRYADAKQRISAILEPADSLPTPSEGVPDTVAEEPGEAQMEAAAIAEQEAQSADEAAIEATAKRNAEAEKTSARRGYVVVSPHRCQNPPNRLQ